LQKSSLITYICPKEINLIGEGTVSPLFLYQMFRDTVKKLLDDSLQNRKDLFLIDFEILEGNMIRVVIDGDEGVLVEDCMYISRAIEHNLDRETEDFSIEVSSAGAATPLLHKRQYQKHIGRVLQIVTFGKEKYEAVLTSTDNDCISLEWKIREPKPKGKGKVTVKKNVSISFKDIDTAKIKLVF